MASHYYSIALANVAQMNAANVTVQTTSDTSNALEVRVDDSAVTAKQAYHFLKTLAEYFASRKNPPINTGVLNG